jgi:hypothetical protein
MRRFLFLSLLAILLVAVFSNAPSSALAQAGGTPAPQDIVPVTLSTPEADGSIIHEVQYGQPLWMIAEAYGVDGNVLIALNNLSGTNPILFPGQKLIIRLAPTPTITPTSTSTLRPPTRTPTLSPTPVTPRPTRTMTPIPSPTPRPLVPDFRKLDSTTRRGLGIGFLAVSVLGLAAVYFLGFRKK